MVIFYKKWKKYNETKLTKNKMDLNIWKITNHPPSPVSRMGTARLKSDKETDEEGKKTGESMERSKAGMKKNKSRRSITS